MAVGELSPATQDYLKAIYVLGARRPGSVGTSALAERLGVSAPSASAMVKRLAELGLVRYSRYHGVELTGEGRAVALEVVRHHRLLELYLHDVLGMAWEEVHEDAERLEHVLSESVEARIAARLGEPTRDPHGDPIPSLAGEVEEPSTVALSELRSPAEGVVVRVSDSDPAVLRRLSDQGIGIGTRVQLIDRRADAVRLRVGGKVRKLPLAVAEAIRVAAT
jgi:DtxR family Mn-dependent transcriptional regulator